MYQSHLVSRDESHVSGEGGNLSLSGAVTEGLTFDPTKRTISHVICSSLQNMFIHQIKSVVISMFHSSRNNYSKKITVIQHTVIIHMHPSTCTVRCAEKSQNGKYPIARKFLLHRAVIVLLTITVKIPVC